jgi:Domain of unknown function (DUF4331)
MISRSGKVILLTALTTATFGFTLHSSASSHREAPQISKYPQVDATDFYLFNSYEPGRENYVVVLANYNPLQASFGGPNYFPLDANALYEIHIDNNGDAREDITFQFQFENAAPEAGVVNFTIGSGENSKVVPAILRNVAPISADSKPGLSFRESFTINHVVGDRRAGVSQSVSSLSIPEEGLDNLTFEKPFDYAGEKTYGGAGNYADYADTFIHSISIPNCDQDGRVFVGQRLDGFKTALGEVFDLINFVPIEADGAPGSGDADGFPGGIGQDPERNQLARNNVTSIALEIHQSCLVGEGNGVIGGWTTASLHQATILNPQATLEKPEVTGGAWTQVSRLGNALVNELMIGFSDKDRFNSSEPKDDSQFLDYITHPVLPAIVDKLLRDVINSTLDVEISDLAPSNIPRRDLVSGFLSGFTGINQMSTVTRAEILRLNTNILATPREEQQPLGMLAGDLSGFPNGRRPGDDTVDITLRAIMGAFCYDLPMATDGTLSNLNICAPDDAPVGNVALTDGAPMSALDFDITFPFLLTPYPGSPIGAPIPTPRN